MSAGALLLFGVRARSGRRSVKHFFLQVCVSGNAGDAWEDCSIQHVSSLPPCHVLGTVELCNFLAFILLFFFPAPANPPVPVAPRWTHSSFTPRGNALVTFALAVPGPPSNSSHRTLVSSWPFHRASQGFLFHPGISLAFVRHWHFFGWSATPVDLKHVSMHSHMACCPGRLDDVTSSPSHRHAPKCPRQTPSPIL